MDNSFGLKTEKQVEFYLKLLESQVERAINEEEYKNLKLKLFKEYSRMLKLVTCDSQRRINISEIDDEAKQFKISGARTSAILKSIK